MGTFLFLLLLFFVIIPLIKVGWRIWQAQRTFSRMQQQMHDTMYGGRRPGAGTATATPKRRKKKIDPEMGEYVAFEEVRAEASQTTETNAGGTGSFRTESQVEDAVWEEIRQ